MRLALAGMELTTTLHILDLLDSAYRLDLDDDAWMRALLEEARPALDRGLGLSGYFVDASAPDGFETWAFGCAGTDEVEERARFATWSEHAPVTLKRHAHLHAPVGYPPGNVARAAIEQSFELTDRADVLGITAIDASGLGCALAIPDPVRQRGLPRSGEMLLWERTSAHLAAALRLRRRLREAEAPAEAVLEPSGRVAHAEEAAKSSDAREQLREAALRFDRARVRGKGGDALAVTEQWRALVAGRWTLVDEFDRDGRRFIVARPNRPASDPLKRLTKRETQVVRAAAFGHSNKLIAYELGVSQSTVSACLRRAVKKLGVRDRLELIRLCAERFGAPPPAPPAHGEN